jgi:hypothetical protein
MQMPQSSLGLLRRRLAAASPHRFHNNDAVRRRPHRHAAFHRNPHAVRVQHLEHIRVLQIHRLLAADEELPPRAEHDRRVDAVRRQRHDARRLLDFELGLHATAALVLDAQEVAPPENRRA